MAIEYKSLDEKNTSEALQELAGQSLTNEDKAEVMRKCDIGDRTFNRYMKGEIGNLLVAKSMVSILRDRIKKRNILNGVTDAIPNVVPNSSTAA